LAPGQAQDAARHDLHVRCNRGVYLNSAGAGPFGVRLGRRHAIASVIKSPVAPAGKIGHGYESRERPRHQPQQARRKVMMSTVVGGAMLPTSLRPYSAAWCA
jgi:hypothetical protein